MGKPVWTDEMIGWLKKHRAEGPLPEIADKFRAKFGSHWKNRTLNRACSRFKIRAGSDGRFKAGTAPWNTGKAGYQSGGASKDHHYKPGNIPAVYKPIGSYRKDNLGQWWYKVRDAERPGESRHGWIMVTRFIWETEVGPVPDGYCVILVDGDQDNCLDVENLACVSRRELVMLNRSGWNKIEDIAARRAAIALVKTFSKAHEVGSSAGIGLRERQSLIGKLKIFNGEMK